MASSLRPRPVLTQIFFEIITWDVDLQAKALELLEAARHSARQRLERATEGKRRPIWPGGPVHDLPAYLLRVEPYGMPDPLRVHLVEFRRDYNAHPARVYCSRATFWHLVTEAAGLLKPDGAFRPVDHEEPFPQGWQVCGVPFYECEALPFGALFSSPPKKSA